MYCMKCNSEIVDLAVYCSFCGKKQQATSKETKAKKSRVNGTGSVYRLDNGTWACQITKYVAGRRKTVRKKGFKSKKQALDYLPQMSIVKKKSKSITILEAYNASSSKSANSCPKTSSVFTIIKGV